MTSRIEYQLVKVGGSLLDWPELPRAFDRWRSAQPPNRLHLLLAGGGAWVNQIRAQQLAQRWNDETAHWLAIDCLAVTAHVLAHRIHRPLWQVVHDNDRPSPATLRIVDRSRTPRPIEMCHPPVALARRAGDQNFTVINAACYLREAERIQPGPLLEVGWCTTSDAIAARIAQLLGIARLCLMKSCHPPTDAWREWANAGYVDAAFTRHTEGIRHVTAINLRQFADT